MKVFWVVFCWILGYYGTTSFPRLKGASHFGDGETYIQTADDRKFHRSANTTSTEELLQEIIHRIRARNSTTDKKDLILLYVFQEIAKHLEDLNLTELVDGNTGNGNNGIGINDTNSSTYTDNNKIEYPTEPTPPNYQKIENYSSMEANAVDLNFSGYSESEGGISSHKKLNDSPITNSVLDNAVVDLNLDLNDTTQDPIDGMSSLPQEQHIFNMSDVLYEKTGQRVIGEELNSAKSAIIPKFSKDFINQTSKPTPNIRNSNTILNVPQCQNVTGNPDFCTNKLDTDKNHSINAGTLSLDIADALTTNMSETAFDRLEADVKISLNTLYREGRNNSLIYENFDSNNNSLDQFNYFLIQQNGTLDQDFEEDHNLNARNIQDSSGNLPVDVVNKTMACFGMKRKVAELFLALFSAQGNSEDKFKFHFFPRIKEPVELTLQDKMDIKRRTVIIVHGLMAHGLSDWVVDMASALNEREDLNVISLDWGSSGNSWKYWKTEFNIKLAGKTLARFIHRLTTEGLEPENIHLIGHDIGAHICGYAGQKIRHISRITGLDPSQPCYTTTNHKLMLTSDDADFVDIIHSNGYIHSLLGFGVPEPIGHVDFYTNGGLKQPRCLQPKMSLLSGMLDIGNLVKEAVCSHGQAYLFYTESIKFTNCSFWGHRWDRKSSSIHQTWKQPCDLDSCSEMGYLADHFPATGSFYVFTNDNEPFCVHIQHVDLQMAQTIIDWHVNQSENKTE